jgi:hypothetical protein
MDIVLPDKSNPMNVLVFKTSVETMDQINWLSPRLDALAGNGSWNFDLTDCDRILRIVSDRLKAEEATRVLMQLGFHCSELED